MEASSLRTAPGRAPLVAGAALLRLKGDEQLVTLVRRGHDGAFEVLFRRYQPRLLAFCRHMLGSTEDAEDVLQESFASAHRAMIADERPIVARAWLSGSRATAVSTTCDVRPTRTGRTRWTCSSAAAASRARTSGARGAQRARRGQQDLDA